MAQQTRVEPLPEAAAILAATPRGDAEAQSKTPAQLAMALVYADVFVKAAKTSEEFDAAVEAVRSVEREIVFRMTKSAVRSGRGT
jgi:hypothetical protein